VGGKVLLSACLAASLLGFGPRQTEAGQATASSSGGLVTDTDASNFLFARGTGTNCVHVDARGTAATSLLDPPVAGAGSCSFTAGLTFTTGIGTTATKPTGIPAPTFSNTATRGGVTATGSALFSYVTGAILDTATYFATANVTGPVAAGVRFAGPDVASGNAEDPIFFTSSSASLPFDANLTSLNLTSIDGESALFANYSLDGNSIFSFSIDAPSDFSSPSQIAINYTSVRGSLFDASLKANLLMNLTISPSSETVSLNGPFALFPLMDLPLGSSGTHVLAGGEAAVAAAGVPEPSTLLLLSVGLLGWGVARRGRGALKT
jgi:hypothetical protein